MEQTILPIMTLSREEDKFITIKSQLEQDEYILVHLNPAKENLQIPDSYRELPTVTLKLSYGYPDELEITTESIKTNLLFDGVYFACELPFDAIWGCSTSTGRNYIWPESINPDSYSLIAGQIESLKSKELDNEEAPTLSEVKAESKETDSDSPPEDPHTPPNLKVIK